MQEMRGSMHSGDGNKGKRRREAHGGVLGGRIAEPRGEEPSVTAAT